MYLHSRQPGDQVASGARYSHNSYCGAATHCCNVIPRGVFHRLSSVPRTPWVGKDSSPLTSDYYQVRHARYPYKVLTLRSSPHCDTVPFAHQALRHLTAHSRSYKGVHCLGYITFAMPAPLYISQISTGSRLRLTSGIPNVSEGYALHPLLPGSTLHVARQVAPPLLSTLVHRCRLVKSYLTR